MKNKDIVLIAVSALLSGVFALILTGYLLPDSDRVAQVEVVEAFSEGFELPDNRYYNEESINPTALIRIDGILVNDDDDSDDEDDDGSRNEAEDAEENLED